MKMTMELPDDLLKEVKLRAIRDGSKLKDAVATLLRKGLESKSVGPPKRPTVVRVDKATLKRRAERTRKFVSGEWGVELAGYEEAQKTDRHALAARNGAWRK